MNCVRDILLELEDLPVACHTSYDFPKSIEKHGIDTVEYALAKLQEGDYINADISLRQDGRYDFLGIYNMTFAGHQFLETIRSPKVWSKLTSALPKIGSASFSLISSIATEILTEAIKNQIL